MMTLSPNQQYHNLDRAFDYFNAELFGGELPRCLITLRKQPRTKGWFHAGNFLHRETAAPVDEICLCATLWHTQPDKEILSTLVHEMVHLWQQHFGDPPRRCYHDREWAAKMEEVGLIPSDTGEPGGKKTGQSMTHYIAAGGPYERAFERLATDFKLEWQERHTEPGGTAGKAKKPTRVKWQCPECEQAAWAKESATLMCGDCEVRLEPAASEQG